jgi:hypothetical protein
MSIRPALPLGAATLALAIGAAAYSSGPAGVAGAAHSAPRTSVDTASEAAPAGIPGSTATLPLDDTRTGATARRSLPATGGAERTDTGRRFSLIGVTWNDPRAGLADRIRISVRDHPTGRWSGWQPLPVSDDDRPDGDSAEATAPGVRGGGAPMWVGDSDGVRVRLAPQEGAGPEALPSGLRLDLVDPGRAPAQTSGAQSRAIQPRAAAPHAAKLSSSPIAPLMVARIGWGADEKLRERKFKYTGAVHAVFIHHTDTGNGYSCAQSPAVIRSIYRYHVKSLHWADIGYNFLVDRCGTVYQGRAGGVDRTVLGAHTLGFNTDTVGVAAIGTYSSGRVPKAVLNALARIAAWKLSAAGISPRARVTLVSGDSGSRYPKGRKVAFNAISGHRDAVATECPGASLYADLPAIRSAAARMQATLASKPTSGPKPVPKPVPKPAPSTPVPGLPSLPGLPTLPSDLD